MTSKFGCFLNEGQIKLPQGTLDEMISFFLRNALGYLSYVGLAKADDEIDERFVHSIIKKLALHFGVPLPDGRTIQRAGTARVLKSEISLRDVSQAYVNRLKKLKGVNGDAHLNGLRIKFVMVMRGKHPLLDGSERGVFDERSNTLVISMEGVDLANELTWKHLHGANYQRFEHLIAKAIGDIEHELTHGVQFLILQRLHKKQADDTGLKSTHTDSGPYGDKYFNSQLEFDPQIKSALANFKLISKKLSPESAGRALQKFVWSDVDVNKLSSTPDESGRSRFFKSLKKNDYKKWKKAVKIFTAAYKR